MPLTSHLSGGAGAAYAPLHPAFGSGSEHAHGPFTAELAPSLRIRASGSYPQLLSLGLFVSKPDPDGVGGKELDYPGYQRQAVELAPRSMTHLAIARPVLFEIFGCPPVTSVALFDDDGEVVAHGVLRGRTTAAAPPARFEFACHQMLVRQP